MRFAVLGPLGCTPDLPVNVSRRREGRILGALLLSANHPVPTSRLIDLLWRDDPPATARQQVQNCTTGLTRLFSDAGNTLPLQRLEDGYLLRLDVDQLDALQFEREMGTAGAQAEAGRLADAARTMRTAVGRWRGDVLLGMDMGPFGPATARLDELRVHAIEQRFEIELRLGQHGEVLADLAAAVAQYPTRETLIGQYMLALSHSGRSPEALQLFRQTRRALREELGIEPGRVLHAVYAAILHSESDEQDGPYERLASAVVLAEAAARQLDRAIHIAREAMHPGTRRVRVGLQAREHRRWRLPSA
jgi:DNA-binding SARP family transcriptional activator